MMPVIPLRQRNSAGNIAHDFGLTMFVLAGVTVRAINNQTMRGCGFGGHFGAYVFHGFGHGFGIVVRAVNRAAQHHMAVRVAKGLDCAGTPQMVNAEERVLLSSGEANR